MPVVNLSKENVLKLLGKKIDDNTLKEKIPMLGTALEQITDDMITVEIFPNRPDMLSEQGFARALSSFLGIKKGLKQYKIIDSKKEIIIDSSVKEVRPYTACAIVKNLKLDEEKLREIIQIQEKLHISLGRNRKKLAIGIYPSEEIKYPIYYKALPPNQIKFTPLETAEDMTAIEILENHPKGKEYAHLLQGKKLFPIFIDSNKQILSMPPIINSQNTGKVRAKTKELFIECSGFDLHSLQKCLNIIVTALADMGGTICSMKMKYPDKTITSPSLEPEHIELNIDYINNILGLNLKKPEAIKLLEKMGYGYSNNKIQIPSYRTDILHQIDLAEDIAIAHGYENFKPELPNISTIAKEDDFEIFKNKIADLLVGFNLLETNSFSLIPKFILDKMKFDSKPISIENASTEYNTLRTWIIPSLLKTLSENRHNEYPQNIFEIGTVFTQSGENQSLAVVLCSEKTNYTEIKKILDSLLSNLGISFTIKETNHNSFISGRTAKIIAKNKEIAIIGELNPEVIRNFELDMPVSCFEINMSEIYKLL